MQEIFLPRKLLGSPVARGPLLDQESNLSLARFRRFHELPDRFEHQLELSILFLLKGVHFTSKVFVSRHDLHIVEFGQICIKYDFHSSDEKNISFDDFSGYKAHSCLCRSRESPRAPDDFS